MIDNPENLLILSRAAREAIESHQSLRLQKQDVILQSDLFENPQGERLHFAVCARGIDGQDNKVIKVSVDGDAYLWACGLYAAYWLQHLASGEDAMLSDRALMAQLQMPPMRLSAAVLASNALRELIKTT